MATDNKGKKILVIDDDIDLLLQVKLQLENVGYTVITAENEKEGYESLSSDRPDLVITDLMMGNMDAGFNLSHRIKKFDSTIPVILVTGVTRETGIDFDITSEEDRQWIKADIILAKPIRFEQLQREIDRLLKD
ncbi:response regulator [Candidatus Latescibacterota bacterium]